MKIEKDRQKMQKAEHSNQSPLIQNVLKKTRKGARTSN